MGNVDDASSYRKVDGIFNAGVLYHLKSRGVPGAMCGKRPAVLLPRHGSCARNEAEMQNSKFARNFGESYRIDYKGLELEAIDFAEPKNTAEKQGDGLRRGPRSGIGNSNSVWLSHRSAIDLMAKLGFPYHETIKDYPNIPRLRTCFFRNPPKPAKALGPLLKPLPGHSP